MNYIYKALLIITVFFILSCDTNSHIPSSYPSLNYIIADHEAVEKYNSIPNHIIDKIKTQWVSLPGESHSKGYRTGLNLLENLDSRFKVLTSETSPPNAYTNEGLRFNRIIRTPYGSWNDGNIGESLWFVTSGGRDYLKNHIEYCNSTDNYKLAAIGFGWCWDMSWQNGPTGNPDPVFNVRWAGSSSPGGTDYGKAWGLNSEDSAPLGNSVSMDTYLQATEEYISFCQDNHYDTLVFFTTGPVDSGYNTEERGYQRFLKHEYIRNYVKQGNNRVLFDYADILSWSGNNQNIIEWEDFGGISKRFPYIHPDNMNDLDGSFGGTNDDHIGDVGALRLAKAMWWMLARAAGWDGE